MQEPSFPQNLYNSVYVDGNKFDNYDAFPSMSNFPTALTAVIDRIYYAQDTDIHYRWNGTTYNVIISAGGGVASVSASTNIVVTGTTQNPAVGVATSPSFTQVSVTAPLPLANGDLTNKLYVDTANGLDLKKASNLSDVQSLSTTKSNLQIQNIPNVKQNLVGLAAPLPTDDNTQGYSIGSRWIFGNNEFVCSSSSTGSAVWVSTTNTSGNVNNYTAIVDPTVNDDDTLLYSIGSRWINNMTDTIFECFKATNPAVWTSNISAASNVGFAPIDVWKDKLDNTLRFRRLMSTNGITLTQNTDTIDFVADKTTIGLGNVENKSLVQTTNQVLITSGVSTLTFSTPQNIHALADTNFASVSLSKANANAVVVSGTNGVIKLNGIGSSIENTGINGNIDRVNIANTRYFYFNNLSNAAMNIFYDANAKNINISNGAGGNTENIFMAIAHNRALFPFASHVNYRADMTQTRIACFWQINGSQPVSNFRFGLMGNVIFENYAQEVGGTTNSRGIYNNNNRNSITLEFTNGGSRRHQNDDVVFTSFSGVHYAANFNDKDIIIIQSSLENPPTIRMHAYNFNSPTGVATWKNSYGFALRSGSMVGGDAHTLAMPYLNTRVNGANANLLSQRWLQNNITSYVNGGTFDPAQTVSYYY